MGAVGGGAQARADFDDDEKRFANVPEDLYKCLADWKNTCTEPNDCFKETLAINIR